MRLSRARLATSGPETVPWRSSTVSKEWSSRIRRVNVSRSGKVGARLPQELVSSNPRINEDISFLHIIYTFKIVITGQEMNSCTSLYLLFF